MHAQVRAVPYWVDDESLRASMVASAAPALPSTSKAQPSMTTKPRVDRKSKVCACVQDLGIRGCGPGCAQTAGRCTGGWGMHRWLRCVQVVDIFPTHILMCACCSPLAFPKTTGAMQSPCSPVAGSMCSPVTAASTEACGVHMQPLGGVRGKAPRAQCVRRPHHYCARQPHSLQQGHPRLRASTVRTRPRDSKVCLTCVRSRMFTPAAAHTHMRRRRARPPTSCPTHSWATSPRCASCLAQRRWPALDTLLRG